MSTVAVAPVVYQQEHVVNGSVYCSVSAKETSVTETINFINDINERIGKGTNCATPPSAVISVDDHPCPEPKCVSSSPVRTSTIVEHNSNENETTCVTADNELQSEADCPVNDSARKTTDANDNVKIRVTDSRTCSITDSEVTIVKTTTTAAAAGLDVEVKVEPSEESLPETEAEQQNINTTSESEPRNEGPNDIAPADSLWAVKRDDAVKLRMSETGPRAYRPLSVTTVFQETVGRYPEHLALAAKVNGAWRSWTYRAYYADVWRAAKALIELGLEPYSGVGILGFNSPEWFITNFAAIFAGGLSTGIYSTNSAEACRYVADRARCNVIVVENDIQLQKILSVRHELPRLKAIVQYHGEPKEKYDQVYSWADFLTLGENCSDDLLHKRIAQQSVNKCCALIYTSGTTGNPKGVMLSHDNVTWTSKVAAQTATLINGSESLVSYLPLSHVAAQILDMYIPLMHAAAVYFAQPDALKGSLVETLKEVHPTAFLGVPRVWEKMHEKMAATSGKQGFLRRGILSWARSVGLHGNISRMNGGSLPMGWRLASSLVFKKVRTAMGLDRCKMCMTAAAPLMKETLDFFASLDMPIMEIYGLSETSGPHTVSSSHKWRLGSVGPTMLGSSITILGSDQSEEGGEVCLEGRNIFMGYLDDEEKTMETLDSEGLFHSGDIGKVDKDGFLYITGRIKELIITAGGENVAPVLIEDAVKEALPCISNCMLVGDRRKFLAILLTLKTEVDPDTSEPLDKLSKSTVEWCKAHGSNVHTVSQLLEGGNGPVMDAIQEGINQANKKAISRAQVIQKFTILPRDFSIAGGELGPTLKLRRPIVAKMNETTINAFYDDQD